MLVELKRVVGERAPKEIASDIHAPTTEPSFCDERIGNLKMRGRQPMCRHSRLAEHLAQPSTQWQGRPGERLRLLAMQRAQVEEGLTGGLLDLTARALKFLGSARMHGDEAGETQE